MDDFSFEEPVDYLGESVVVAVPDASSRGLEAGSGKSPRAPDRNVLRAVIAMMNEPTAVDEASAVQGLFESIEDEARLGRTRNRPADDTASESVGNRGDINRTPPGGDVGKLCEPESIRPRRLELPPHVIERQQSRRARERRSDPIPANGTRRPIARVRHATVQRAAAIPSQPSCRQTLRTP